MTESIVFTIDGMTCSACAAHVEAIDLEGRLLGVNVGVAVFPEDGTDEDALLSTADHRMYQAKTHWVAVWAQ